MRDRVERPKKNPRRQCVLELTECEVRLVFRALQCVRCPWMPRLEGTVNQSAALRLVQNIANRFGRALDWLEDEYYVNKFGGK